MFTEYKLHIKYAQEEWCTKFPFDLRTLNAHECTEDTYRTFENTLWFHAQHKTWTKRRPFGFIFHRMSFSLNRKKLCNSLSSCPFLATNENAVHNKTINVQSFRCTCSESFGIGVSDNFQTKGIDSTKLTRDANNFTFSISIPCGALRSHFKQRWRWRNYTTDQAHNCTRKDV